MGLYQQFRCTTCKYSAEICAGPSALFAGYTDTYVCDRCHTLHQLLIEEFRRLKAPGKKKKSALETGSEIEAPKKEYDFFPPHCPECHNKKLQIWNPKTRLCPKCSGKMRRVPGTELYMD